MSSARWVGRTTTAFITVVVTIAMLGQTAVAQEAPPNTAPTTTAPPREPGGPSNGQAAIEQHGPEMAEIAARYDMSEAELRNELASDKSLHVDPDGALFYIDPAHHEPAHSDDEPLVAATPPLDTATTFTLHSKPDADRTIYLDFLGGTVENTQWNASYSPGAPMPVNPFSLDADGTTFSTAEHELIQSVWLRMSEDFAPFDVDVTTELNAARVDRTSAGDTEFGTRVLFAGSGTVAWDLICEMQCGGVAYLDVFDLYQTGPPTKPHSYYQPAWVFQDGTGSAKAMAEAGTHEAGHNLSLIHDGRDFLPYDDNDPDNGDGDEGYYTGHGVWAPIMGVGYSKPVVQWSKGDYVDADNQEDDLALIAAAGAPLAVDDHGNTAGAASAFPAGSAASVQGTIHHEDDVDVFSIAHSGGLLSLHATPAPVSPNLDIEMTILDNLGSVVATVNPTVAAGSPSSDVATGMDASYAASLDPGTYFVEIDGVGHLDAATGYTDYASLGQYRIDAELGICGVDDDLDDDDASTTTYLVPGQSITGKRCFDDDWIRVPGIAGVGLSTTLTVLDGDLTVDVMDSTGTNPLATDTATTTTPGSTTVTIPANADHYIRITGTGESRYTLDTSVASPFCPPDDQYEGLGGPDADDWVNWGTELAVDGSRDAIVCGADTNRSDYMDMALTAGRTVTVDMDYDSSIGTTLWLFRLSGGTYSSVASGAASTDKLTLTYTPPTTDTYYLRVQKADTIGAIQYHLETSQAAEQAPTVSDVSPGTAALGADVTITGTNFGTVSDVDFTGESGPVAATFTVDSLTTITATVPEGAIDGPITVTNGAGSAVSDTFDVDTPLNTAPTASFVFPTESPVKGIIDIQVEARDLETSVSSVDFYVDSALIGTATETDGEGYWSLRWNSAAHGDGQLHTFEAVAYDTEGLDSTPAQMTPMILSSTAGDFNGDGTTDLSVYRPSDGTWHLYDTTTRRRLGPIINWGYADDTPLTGDFNGDGTTDLSVYRPSDGTWHLYDTTTRRRLGPIINWGYADDTPLTGDFNGDGTTDLSVYRPSDGTWHLYDTTTRRRLGPIINWGYADDTPLTGDFNGDGTTDLSVYRPSDGTWHLYDTTTRRRLGPIINWGYADDTPLTGDFNGDGTTDLSVYRPSDGTWHLYDTTTRRRLGPIINWGYADDTPLTGDFNGDGTTDLSVYRPSDGTWHLYDTTTRRRLGPIINWGYADDTPLTG